MNNQKEKLTKVLRDWFASATAINGKVEDLVDHLYSCNCRVMNTIDDVEELLPRPKYFVIENDTKKFPGWDQYMLLELTPDITWEGKGWGVQYDFPAAYKRTVFESLPYYNDTQRENALKEAEEFFKSVGGVIEE